MKLNELIEIVKESYYEAKLKTEMILPKVLLCELFAATIVLYALAIFAALGLIAVPQAYFFLLIWYYWIFITTPKIDDNELGLRAAKVVEGYDRGFGWGLFFGVIQIMVYGFPMFIESQQALALGVLSASCYFGFEEAKGNPVLAELMRNSGKIFQNDLTNRKKGAYYRRGRKTRIQRLSQVERRVL